MDEDLVNYHLKELHCSAQCLIEDAYFVKRLRSTYIFGFGYKFKVTWLVDTILGYSTSSSSSLYLVFFTCDHYIEPTELKIQEMVNILVSGEAY